MADKNIGELTILAPSSVENANDRFVVWDNSAIGADRTKAMTGKGLRDWLLTPIVTVSASKTLAVSDTGTIQDCTNTSLITITIPANSTADIPIGGVIKIDTETSGINLVLASGVTLQNKTDFVPTRLLPRAGLYTLTKLDADLWMLEGAIEPSLVFSRRTHGRAVVDADSTNSGSASIVGVVSNVQGIVIDCGSAVAGRAWWGSPMTTSTRLIELIAGKSIYFSSTCVLSALSDGTRTFTARWGLVSAVASESTDGVFFRHSTANSGNYECVCRNNTTEAVVNTSLLPNTSRTLEILINGTTSAEFWIDGTLQATITTNLPTGSLRRTGWTWGGIIASVGSGARTITVTAGSIVVEL